MKRLFLAALAAASVSLPTLALAESKTLDVAPFTGIDITSGITAHVALGGAQSVVAESPDAEDLANLKYEVRNGVLRVSVDWSFWRLFDTHDRKIVLTIGAPALDTVLASSGASVDVASLGGDKLTLEASSGAYVKVLGAVGKSYRLETSSGAGLEVSGTCTDAQAESSSGASVQAKSLACATVDAEASSGAHIEITATKTISAESSSGAGITVWGKPSVDHLETSSGGNVDFPG